MVISRKIEAGWVFIETEIAAIKRDLRKRWPFVVIGLRVFDSIHRSESGDDGIIANWDLQFCGQVITLDIV